MLNLAGGAKFANFVNPNAARGGLNRTHGLEVHAREVPDVVRAGRLQLEVVRCWLPAADGRNVPQ